MKRTRWILLGLIVLAVLAGGFATYRLLEPGSTRLSNGTRVRPYTVTTGTEHHITFPTRSWFHHYRKEFARPIRNWHYTQVISRPHGGTGATSNGPSTVIWFQFDRILTYEATLVTSDGQRYETKGANGPTTDGYGYAGMKFPVVSAEPTLKLDVRFNGEPFHFEVANPAHGQRENIAR